MNVGFRRVVWAENRSVNSVFSWHPLAWPKETPQMDPGTAGENSRRIPPVQLGKRETSVLVASRVAARAPNTRDSEAREPSSVTRAVVSRGWGQVPAASVFPAFGLGPTCSYCKRRTERGRYKPSVLDGGAKMERPGYQKAPGDGREGGAHGEEPIKLFVKSRLPPGRCMCVSGAAADRMLRIRTRRWAGARI